VPHSEAIMLEMAERLRAVADSIDAELRAILTPKQRTNLDAMRSDSRVLLKRRTLTPGGVHIDTLLHTTMRRRQYTAV
jgi:hypothetical protein